MTSWADTVREVTWRAKERCEYCCMHQSLQGATFHVEHILPSSQGGTSTLSNLALSCPGCNLRKADRTVAIDPESKDMVPFFNPRTNAWEEHFAWTGFQITGLTPTGRATIECLALNHPRRIKIRSAEELFDLFPPDTDSRP